MSQKPVMQRAAAEKVVKDIRRATRHPRRQSEDEPDPIGVPDVCVLQEVPDRIVL